MYRACAKCMSCRNIALHFLKGTETGGGLRCRTDPARREIEGVREMEGRQGERWREGQS